MEIPREDLERALGREVASYTVTAVEPELRIHSVTGGVYRVSTPDASVVVKVVRDGGDEASAGLWVAGEAPTHRNYWKREWLAFDTGLLDRLPGELRAPRCLLTTEPSRTECWIWMEDVEGRSGVRWAVGEFDSAAFDVGTTQGCYAAEPAAVPDEPWVAREWLAGWVEACRPTVELLDDDALWRDEQVADLATLRPRIRALWQARTQLLGIVAGAPRTLVHCDLWPANLIAADDGTTVAVDWSQIGVGALGQDLDQLTLDSVWMQVLPDEPLESLEAHVLPAYLAGLRHAGADVEESELRTWYAAAAGAHYPWLAAAQAAGAADPDRVRAQERRHGRPYAALLADRTRVIRHAVELGELALEHS